MTMMHAIQVQELSLDFSGVRLVELPIPTRTGDDVLIRIEAAALGFPDVLMTRGGYQAKPALPFVPGMECAGVVMEVPEGSRWKRGDRVIAGSLTGAVAQFGCFADSALMPLPDRLSFAQGAALRAAYLTAWVALVRRGSAQAGETLLVHGAAGGVGLAAVDLGLALGLKVIAAASTDAKREAIRSLYGSAQVIESRPGFREEVLALTGGKGADLIYDPVGGDIFDESTRCIAFDGRLLVIGFAAGRIPQIGANIALIKGFSVVGVRAGEYGRRFPDRGAENLSAILALADQGKITPNIYAMCGLHEWQSAFRAMESRSVVGRTVILPHMA